MSTYWAAVTEELHKFYEKIEAEVLANENPPFDIATLEAAHNFFEFEANDDIHMDAWLHAQIKKSKRGASAGPAKEGDPR